MALSKEELDALNEKYPGENAAKALTGANLTLPQFVSTSRINLFNSHLEQFVMVKDPETPLVFTGYEKAYGTYTDSYKKAESDVKVIDVISKFDAISRFNYIYITQDILTGVYDVVQVDHCEKMSESHGYIRPITEGDMYMPGSIIPKGSTIYKASSKDEYDNYRYGVNAKVAYISIPETEEDGIVFSESFSKKTVFYTVEKTDIILNVNDVLLNVYGDDFSYKSFPDIGNEIKDGILCVKRKINYGNAASELTNYALQHVVANDEVFYGDGKVTDIDIWVNSKEEFENAGNRQQILLYYYAIYEYNKKINQALGSIVNNKKNKYTSKLRWVYEQSRNYIDTNIKWSSNSSNFEFALITITTHKEINLLEGYKTTDRYGGKGVICHIWPDEYMPYDEYGNKAEVILSPPGIIARANIGQLYEHELNFISEEIRKRLDKIESLDDKITYIVQFVTFVNENEGLALQSYLNKLNKFKKEKFFESVRNDGIFLHELPFGGNLSLSKIKFLYEFYNVKPSKVRMSREFTGGRTNIKPKFKKAIPLIDKDLEFSIYNNDLYDDEGFIDAGITPYDLKKGESWVGDGYEYIPDGEGGYEAIKTKDIYQMLQAFYSDKTPLPEETEAYMKNGVLVRTFNSIRPVVIANKYMLVLKHVPEGKFSARSVGSMNQVGIPNKPGKNISGTAPYSSTAIRFGEMELNNSLIRVEPEIVHRFMATHATNPGLRAQLVEMLLTKDPLEIHDLDIESEDIMDDVPALMTDAFLFSIGIEISETPKEEK